MPDDYEMDESWERTQAYWASPEGVARQLAGAFGARCSVCGTRDFSARLCRSCHADERYDAMEQAR